MIVYLDTSVLVAAYVEAHSSEKAHKLRRSARVATSILSYAEALGVFGVLMRTGALSRRAAVKIESQFLSDWNDIHCVKLERRLLPEVRRLISTYSLKGADAIQLASASLVARSLAGAGMDYRFASADRQLARAAENEGLVLAG
jgi:uncharacterized protein